MDVLLAHEGYGKLLPSVTMIQHAAIPTKPPSHTEPSAHLVTTDRSPLSACIALAGHFTAIASVSGNSDSIPCALCLAGPKMQEEATREGTLDSISAFHPSTEHRRAQYYHVCS